jgi:hypothetical protein
MKDGDECWAWTTKNPDKRIGTVELWEEFSLNNIFLEKTKYDHHDSDHYYATKKEEPMIEGVEPTLCVGFFIFDSQPI